VAEINVYVAGGLEALKMSVFTCPCKSVLILIEVVLSGNSDMIFYKHHNPDVNDVISESKPYHYFISSGALSLGVKRPGRKADHSPPSSAEVKECVELYLHSPNTPSWRGAQLKHRDNFTFK
jgi:hypothetical protein